MPSAIVRQSAHPRHHGKYTVVPWVTIEELPHTFGTQPGDYDRLDRAVELYGSGNVYILAALPRDPALD